MKLLLCVLAIVASLSWRPTIEAQTTAVVVNTGGDRLNCRSGYPDGTIIGKFHEGQTVQLRGNQENGWYPVYCDGQEGWASASYLSTTGEAPPPPPIEPTGPSTTLYVTTQGVNLNCRSSYPSGAIIGKLPPSSSVTTRGSQENGWWPVYCGGQSGWASGQYLSSSPQQAPQEPEAPPPSDSSLASYALQYVGYNYVHAGTHPSTGFDCSGFTYWIFLNVRGINIGTGTDSQAAHGSFVGWNEWQSGDLLFFINTGGTGGYYSHVGLYVGDGQFVHAQNENTGVVVSNIYSNYYSSHYATARRI